MTTTTQHTTGQLSKELKDKINNGALKCMGIKNMAETFLGKMKDDLLEIIPRLAESVNRNTKKSGNPQKQPFTNARPKTLRKIFKGFNGGHMSFVGPAGSGKSTLLRTIAQNVIDQKYESLLDVEVVVYNKCGDLDTKKITTPAKLLLSNLQPQLSDAELKEFENFAKDNPEKVLFMLDGLDTLPGYFYQTDKTTPTRKQNQRPENKKRVKDILRRLMEGNLFPDCRVITSSRDNTELGQRKMCTVKVVNLLGLTTTSIKKITYQYLPQEEAEEILSYLDEQPELLDLCQTPMFLVFTLIGKKNDPKFSPTMMSEILLFLFDGLIRSEHSKLQKSDIGKLGELCYHLIKEQKVNFSVDDVNKYHLSLDKIHDLVITTPGGQNRTLFFVHQSIVEILACFHISKMIPKRFKPIIREWLRHPNFSIIEPMLCGILLNHKIYDKWSSFLKVDFLEEKRTELMNHLRVRLRKIHIDPQPLVVLDVILSLHEAGDSVDALIRSSLDSVVIDWLFPFYVLSLSDMRAIGSVIAKCDKMEKLAINYSSMDDDNVNMLYSCIAKTQPKISTVEFIGNCITTDGMIQTGRLIRCCRVEHLSLACSVDAFRVTDPHEALQSLKSALLDYKLQTLDISYNVEGLGESEMTPEQGTWQLEVRYKVDQDQKLSLPEKLMALIQPEVVWELPIGGVWSEASYDFAHAIGSLLKNVIERLNAYNWKFTKKGKEVLQKKLDDTRSMELDIFLSDDLILSAKDAPRPTEKYSDTRKNVPTHAKLVEVVDIEEIEQRTGQHQERSKLKPTEQDVAGPDIWKQESSQPKKEPEHDFLLKLDNVQSVQEMIDVFLEHKSTDFHWIQKFRISHHAILEEDLSKLSAMFSKLVALDQIELRNCNLNYFLVSQLKDILKESTTQVSTVCVTATKDIGQVLPTICDVMNLCHAKGLNVQECEENIDLLRLLQVNIRERKLVNLCKLDLSYNKFVEDYAALGEILSGRITELKLVNCDLETEKLEAICGTLHDSKVESLDMSYNADLEEDDIRLLPKLLNKENVLLLALRGCGLSDDDLEGFDDPGFGGMKVHKMDLSYNEMLGNDGVEIVGQTAKKLHTRELALGSCDLDEHCLKSLKTSLSSHNLTHLDVRDNAKIASNPEISVELLRQCGTKHLNISQCKMGPHQVSTLAETLLDSGHKLLSLNLSDSGRTVDDTFIKAVGELVDVVDKELTMCFRNLEKNHKDQLQASLNQSNNETLRITYDDRRWRKNVEYLTLVGRSVPEFLKKEVSKE